MTYRTIAVETVGAPTIVFRLYGPVDDKRKAAEAELALHRAQQLRPA